MTPVRIALHPEFSVGAIDPRVYGSFVEHLGRCVYGGVYEPGHPEADAQGFRRDVLGLVRELGVTVVRYPGGNFVSGYRWEDGVGPREARPRRLDPAWGTVETNEFGTDDFVRWCREAGAEPLMAVNLGTRGMEEARALLEYCNVPGGTAWSDLRRRNGSADPHRIRLWCLGNEMDGPWQMGHKTAEEYGRLACETGRLMRMIDPSIELVACGSSNGGMPEFPRWDATVLEHTADVVDHLSLHLYLGRIRWMEGRPSEQLGLAEFLAQPVKMDRQIEAVIATADHVQAVKRRKKPFQLCFDEWNVWYHSMAPGWPQPERWSVAPPQLEDPYTLADALVAGGMLLSLLRHADRVRIACLAQLVNVIAPIVTRTGGPAWRQTIFWPFLHASRHGRGVSLRTVVRSEAMEAGSLGTVPVVDAQATHDPETGAVVVFAINRGEADVPLAVDLRGFAGGYRVAEHVVVDGADPLATNTEQAPAAVVPRVAEGAVVTGGEATAVLPGLSWNVLRLVPVPR